MWKKKERWTAAALLLAMVVVTGLCWYILYIRQQFYDEGTRNLLETYEQVDKSFTIFSRSNWNMLNEWGKSLQAANEEGLAEERLRSYEAEREIWRYSSVYLFNENCEYWSIRGKHEKVDHLWTAFEEMYRTGKPTVSSYIMRSGERRAGETANTQQATGTQTAADPNATQQVNPVMSTIVSILPLVLIIVLLYFMMIRPQRKKEKETKAMINAMKVGDKVVTIGGICGKVAKIKDEYVFIETGNIGTPDQKSVVKMERDAIRTVETAKN